MIPVKTPDIFGTGIPGMLEHEELAAAIELVMVVVVEIIPFKSIIEFGLKLVVVVVLDEILHLDSVILVIVVNA